MTKTAAKAAATGPGNPTPNSASNAKAVSKTTDQSPTPGADYIPCRFTYQQLKNLNAPDQVLKLSSADAEALLENVTAVTQQQEAAGKIASLTTLKILEGITKENLAGKSPSEALQTIIKDLAAAKASTPAAQPESADKQAPAGTSGSESSQSFAPIIDAARVTIDKLSRPEDIGCAMSILSYNETTRAFGFIIANNYIAVQVVVRNLNREQQFVLHDVEYSVNSDLHGTPGRFFSGRDKIVVRSLASAEGSFDPRNIVVHGAQAAGALLTTLVPIYGAGSALASASAAYNGGFFPGLDKVWKDLSTDQLNLLNDTGFSSTASSQTVVPKTSTVMFITFIPSKQFENGWWTQSCVDLTPLGRISNRRIGALVPLLPGDEVAENPERVPVDDAIHACASLAFKRYVTVHSKWTNKRYHPPDLLKVPVSDETPDDKVCKENGPSKEEPSKAMECAEPSVLYANVPKRIYKHWSGNSVALFEELSNVVVSGMHIVESADLQPQLTSLDCPKNDTGDVILPASDTGEVSCPMKGKNLGKVKSLRLRNVAETGYLDGNVKPASGDDSSATAAFPVSALHALDKADYEVLFVSTNGVETSTSQVLHFDLNQPYVIKIDPTTIDMSKPDALTLTLTGYHLAKATELHLTVDGTETKASFKVNASDREVKVPLSVDELEKLGSKEAKLKCSLVVSGTESPVSGEIEFKPQSDAAKSPVAAKPAATVPKTAKKKKTKP